MGLVKFSRPVEAATTIPARLDDADPARRRAAARALGLEPGSEALLCAALARESDPAVREAILLSLIARDTQEAAEGLARFLSSEEPELRNGALESLAAMPDHATRLLERMSASDDPDVRIFAVLLAGEFPQGWIEGWLIDLMEEDTDAIVCAAIAEVLSDSGTAAAVPALRALPDRFPDEPFLHFVATTVLARIGAKEG